MQPSNIQKDKTELINWINQLEDITILEELKMLMQAEQSGDNFTLTDEQKQMVRESAAEYFSGKHKCYTLEETQHNAITSFYNLSEEQMADIRERDRKHISGQEPGSSWEEAKKRILAKLDEKKA